ncbi:hypothetical protein, partial [Fluviicola chungangensis]|uniref:hypothetical protein n=1 Tax=Fluviicola chungangensis TaxID=2597671 RepID=UPI001C9269AE
ESLNAFKEQIKGELSEDSQIPLNEIEILLEYNDENDDDHELQFSLKADNGSYFTDSELLFKINNKVTKQLANLDKHFFEGLSLLKKSQPPLYSLDLGS